MHYVRYVIGACLGIIGMGTLSVGQGLVNASLWLMDRDDLMKMKREFAADIKTQWANKQR
jgi:hypothetical protein